MVQNLRAGLLCDRRYSSYSGFGACSISRGNYLCGENKRAGCRAYRLRQYPRMYILHTRDSICRAYRETGERKRLRNKSREIPILCKWKSYCKWRYRWFCESNFRCEIRRMAWLSYDRNRRYRNDSRGCGGKKIRNHRTRNPKNCPSAPYTF